MNDLLIYIASLIKGTKFENNVFVVGGYVRDQLIERPSKDIDLVVSLNEGGIRLAQFLVDATGSRTENNPVIYPRFGTAKFYIKGFDDEIEAVMTRSETYTKGSRKPMVNYGSLVDDATRRDLTINTLYRNVSDGELIDPTGKAIQDIENKCIRTPLDPNQTFKDDPLRMMRVIRFACKFDWMVTPDTSNAIVKNSKLIKSISVERFSDEFKKILCTDNAHIGLTDLYHSNLLSHMIPELEQLAFIPQNEYHEDLVFDHTLKVVEKTKPDLITRLGALFHDIGKEKTFDDTNDNITFHGHESVGADISMDILKRLAFSNDIVDRVARIVRMHMRLKQAGSNGDKITNKGLRKFVRDAGDDIERILDVIHADNMSHHPDHCMPNQIPEILNRIKNLKSVSSSQHIKLPVTGEDVMEELQIKPSKLVGDVLREVEEHVFENPYLTRQQALEIIRKFL